MEDSQAAQLLAEFMIQRKADKEGKKLTPQFWNSLVWKKQFQQQKIAAYGLLKLYSYESILEALKHKDIKWVFSLRMKNIIPYIKDEEEKRKQRKERAIGAEEIVVNTSQTVDVMTNCVPQTGRSRLRKLD